jgi:AraC-like DNA-binding protein
MVYREQLPDLQLPRWVECSWTLQSEAAVPGHPVRPDGCLDLLWAPGSGVQVVGTMTAERRFDLPEGSRTFGIRFRPGMASPFLGVAAAELTDRIVALADLRGSAAARRMEARLAESLPVLSSVLPAPAGAPDRVHLAIEAITAAHGDIDLDWVARHAGLGARQFRRRCLEESGLTPKHLCRVLRFRRACALAHPAADWAEIAAGAGYFDQSHLIRDFREFTGRTPVSVFSNTRRAVVR